MRGEIDPQASMFSYVDLESRIPKDHPIRKVRKIVDAALQEIEPWFDDLYATGGRPSIPPDPVVSIGSVHPKPRARRSGPWHRSPNSGGPPRTSGNLAGPDAPKSRPET